VGIARRTITPMIAPLHGHDADGDDHGHDAPAKPVARAKVATQAKAAAEGPAPTAE
jgi:hypothetical protein